MPSGLDRLQRVVARLRSPRGCPWDRRQTHVSLIPYLREESRELAVALRRGRWHEIEDELGDLLFHVILHARIAAERGRFTLDEVARSQARKLMRRHPHVFGRGLRLRTAEEVLERWPAIKARERRLRRRDVARRAARAARRLRRG